VDALKNHQNDPGVQDTASWALMVLAWSNQDLLRQVKAAGALELVRKVREREWEREGAAGGGHG
jgi:hypothetical protein